MVQLFALGVLFFIVDELKAATIDPISHFKNKDDSG